MEKSINAYLKSFESKEKKTMKELRSTINSVAKFEETIAWSMPAFKYKGNYVAGFKMYAHHLGFYPFSGSIIKQFSKELKDFHTSVGGIQLPKGKKLPKMLIKKIVKTRMRDIISKGK